MTQEYYYIAVTALDYLGRPSRYTPDTPLRGDKDGRPWVVVANQEPYYYDNVFSAYGTAQRMKAVSDCGRYRYTYRVMSAKNIEKRWRICARHGENSAVMYASTFNRAWGKIEDLGRIFDIPEVSLSKQIGDDPEKYITVQLGTDFTRGGLIRLLEEKGLL